MDEQQPTSPPSRRRLRIVQVLTLLIVLGASIGAVYLRDHIQELASFGYLAVFIVGLVSNATVILPLPGLAVSSLMGGVFDPWLVGIVGGIGQGLGELSGYMVGYSSQKLVDRGSTYEFIYTRMQRYGMLAIFVLALVPNPLFDMGGIAAGALRFPVWKFLVACIAGKIIKNVLFAWGGYLGLRRL
ncbi:MAG: VTT domain-containing protein [Anaerolineae bacterium]|nr:VTT domain-containing protein [Anaerolineae bacterium]